MNYLFYYVSVFQLLYNEHALVLLLEKITYDINLNAGHSLAINQSKNKQIIFTRLPRLSRIDGMRNPKKISSLLIHVSLQHTTTKRDFLKNTR